MSPPKVSIIILQFNNSQDTLRCLDSVKELDCPNFDVIIIDNASAIEHINSIRFFIESQKDVYPATHYSLLATHSNLGYSGGNNIGIKRAMEHGADYILILNPDTTVEKNLLSRLVETAESHKNIGVLQPTVKEDNQNFYGGGEIKWLNINQPQSTETPASAVMKKGIYVMGSAMLIKKEVVERVGLFDERYFLYFEDTDYSLRVQKAKYELGIEIKTTVEHQSSSSTNLLGSPLLLRYHYRNAHLFNWKNGPFWIKIALPFWSFFIIIKQLIKIVFVPARKKISILILRGVIDFYIKRFGQIES